MRSGLVSFFLVVLLGAGPASAQIPALVDAVLELGQPGAEASCAYTRTRLNPEHSKTERYDPSDPESPWRLVAMDGQPPTTEQLRRYAQDADDRSDRRHPLEFDIRSMVSPDGWELVSETADEVTYRFRLRPSDEIPEHLVDKVRGTMVVARDPLRPVRITIENTEPAYVAPFVRVAEFFQELRFSWSDAVDGPVLTEIETRRRGRALAVKSLRKDKIVHYGDYDCSSRTPQAAG